MRVCKILSLLAVAGALAGCHRPISYPTGSSFQNNEVTVRDWQIAAHDVTSELIAAGLVFGSGEAQSQTGRPRPIFIQVNQANSMFLHEAADELQADILRRGGTVSRTPNHAVVVSLEVDVVRWSHDRQGFPPTFTDHEAVLKATVLIEDQLVRKLVEPVYIRNGDVALYSPQSMVLPARLLRYTN